MRKLGYGEQNIQLVYAGTKANNNVTPICTHYTGLIKNHTKIRKQKNCLKLDYIVFKTFQPWPSMTKMTSNRKAVNAAQYWAAKEINNEYIRTLLDCVLSMILIYYL